MCGRYYRRSNKQRLSEAFHLGRIPDDFVPPDWDYNVAPTTHQPVIVIRLTKEQPEREMVLMRWGMVPHSAKFIADFKGFSTINAKAETLINSAMWRLPFQRRRCLVPADGFYEWEKINPKTKQPYAFMMADEKPFAFAGVWEAGRTPRAIGSRAMRSSPLGQTN